MATNVYFDEHSNDWVIDNGTCTRILSWEDAATELTRMCTPKADVDRTLAIRALVRLAHAMTLGAPREIVLSGLVAANEHVLGVAKSVPPLFPVPQDN